MKIKCNKEDMLFGIQTVQKAVSTKSTLKILTGILIKTLDDNHVKLTATNLELTIETKVKAEIIEHGSVVISSKLISEIVRKLPEENIFINSDENNVVFINSGKSEFKLSGMSSEDFPEVPQIVNKGFFSISQNLFKDMIRQTVFAVSEDETKQVLMGECLQIKNNSFRLVALDGYRIALREGEGINSYNDEFVKQLIIPGKTMNELMKILSSSDEDNFIISSTDNEILFDLGDTRVISRLIDGKYINYESFIPTDFNTCVSIEKDRIIDCLDRAYIMARESSGNNLIKLDIKDNLMYIVSNSDIGGVIEELEIKKQGEDIEIAFNSIYLLDALKSIDSLEVVMKFINNVSPCIIVPSEMENQLNLVLPVKLR